MVMGTPGYMAPEQARGEVHQIDARCDVFGLGAILCVILTGKSPYEGLTHPEAYRQAVEGDLDGAHARLSACSVDAELVRLARQCLAGEPRERPGDAGIVALALTNYRASVGERLWASRPARLGLLPRSLPRVVRGLASYLHRCLQGAVLL
jgi:serine/threonine-protein kinase